jgi:hypothetical protein
MLGVRCTTSATNGEEDGKRCGSFLEKHVDTAEQIVRDAGLRLSREAQSERTDKYQLSSRLLMQSR